MTLDVFVNAIKKGNKSLDVFGNTSKKGNKTLVKLDYHFVSYTSSSKPHTVVTEGLMHL